MAALLAEMEQAGLGFDPWLLRQGGQVARDRMAAIEQECEGLAGRPFNLASPSQLAEVLYNVLKVCGTCAQGGRYKCSTWAVHVHNLEPTWAVRVCKVGSTYASKGGQHRCLPL